MNKPRRGDTKANHKIQTSICLHMALQTFLENPGTPVEMFSFCDEILD